MSDAHPKIPASLAPARLLFMRSDLARQKRQRRRAAALASAVGRSVPAVEILAGWLGANTDQDVGDLESLLGDRVTVHLAGLDPDERSGVDVSDLHAVLAMELGWKGLRGHGPREVLKVLALAGSKGAPRPTVEAVAQAGSGAVDDVLAACFALESEGSIVRLAPFTRAFVQERPDRDEDRRGRVQRWMETVRRHLDEGVPGIADAAGEAMDLAARGSQKHLVAALSLSLAGRLRRRGRLTEARTRAATGRDVLRSDSPRVRAIRAALELELGLIELAVGDTTAARIRLEQATASLEGSHSRDSAAVTILRERIRIACGQALLAKGAAEAALELLDFAAPEEQDVDAVRRQTLATVLLELGDEEGAAAALPAPEEVPEKAHHAAAVALTRARAGSEDRDALLEQARVLAGGNLDRPASPALCIALHEQGVAAATRGEYEAAATLLDEASMLATSLLPKRHALRCTISYTRGLLFLAAGERGRAERQLDRAADSWSALGSAGHPRAILARATQLWVQTGEPGRQGRDALGALQRAADTLAAEVGEEEEAVQRLRALHREA